MPAINDSANVVVYQYKNKEFVLKNYSFPASMDSFEEMRKYLQITTKVTSSNFPYYIIVYSGQWNEDIASKEYAVEVDLFGDAGALIICPTFIDLIHLFNELKGFSELENGAVISDILNDIRDMSITLDQSRSSIDLIRSELRLEIERVANLIETGIEHEVKNHINEATREIVTAIENVDTSLF